MIVDHLNHMLHTALPHLSFQHIRPNYKHHYLKVPHKDIVEDQVKEQDGFIHLTAV
jgi:hypothetical protein